MIADPNNIERHTTEQEENEPRQQEEAGKHERRTMENRQRDKQVEHRTSATTVTELNNIDHKRPASRQQCQHTGNARDVRCACHVLCAHIVWG